MNKHRSEARTTSAPPTVVGLSCVCGRILKKIFGPADGTYWMQQAATTTKPHIATLCETTKDTLRVTPSTTTPLASSRAYHSLRSQHCDTVCVTNCIGGKSCSPQKKRTAHYTPPNAELRTPFLGNPDLELRKISAQSPTATRLRLFTATINRGSASSPPRGVYTLVALYAVTLFALEADP